MTVRTRSNLGIDLSTGASRNDRIETKFIVDLLDSLYTRDDTDVLTDNDINATAAEINNVADVSARVQELTASGAITAGIQSVELNHATVAIAATIADAVNHQGLFIVKDTSATGTIAHTLTLTAGTFNGTNTIATFNARDEMLVVYFDSTGRGQVIANVGAVALS